MTKHVLPPHVEYQDFLDILYNKELRSILADVLQEA
jgi:hypothetical protein